ncbi:hypothetical protein LGM46_10350 [Burkholderia arboris]|uniref:hypothetical protein n=1 Tax=Burkholderia arboris TaxID=488730 RepID=UPI001CF166FA|nr:hypothetical protein [Burkholderia arboris]MCA8033390.1 hypothetical protein [Burkholderia arboris]
MKQRMGWLSRLLQSGGGILFAPMRATIIDQWISDYQAVRMHDIGAPGRKRPRRRGAAPADIESGDARSIFEPMLFRQGDSASGLCVSRD